MGFRGSANPIETVKLNSFIGDAILGGKTGTPAALDDYRDDFLPFKFVLLHPNRTFVEKLLALHSSLLQGVDRVRTRHYYDVFALFTRHPDIPSFVGSPDFRTLVGEAIEIGNENFGTDMDPKFNLAESPALNLKSEQIRILENQYRGEARYYFRDQPPFTQIVEGIFEIRSRLAASS